MRGHHSPPNMSRVALPPGSARAAISLSSSREAMPPCPQRCPPSPRMQQRQIGAQAVQQSSPPSPSLQHRSPPSPPMQNRMVGTSYVGGTLVVPSSPAPTHRVPPPGVIMTSGTSAPPLPFSAQASETLRSSSPPSASSPPSRTRTPVPREANWAPIVQTGHEARERWSTPTPHSASSSFQMQAAAGTPGFGHSESFISNQSIQMATPPLSSTAVAGSSAAAADGNGSAASSSPANPSNFAYKRAVSEPPELFDSALAALRGDQAVGQFHTLMQTMLQASQSIQQLPDLLQKLDARLSSGQLRTREAKSRGRSHQAESSLSPPRRLSSTSSTNTAVIVEESPMGTPPSAQRSGSMSAGQSPIPCARACEASPAASPPSFALAEAPTNSRSSKPSPPSSVRLGPRARLADDVSEAVELSGDEQEPPGSQERQPKDDATFSSCMTIQPQENDEHVELVKALAEREAANAELRRELTEKSAEVESKDQEIAEIRTTVHRLEAFIESQNAELVTELRRHAGKIAGLERAGGTGSAPDNTALAGLLGSHQRVLPRGGSEQRLERLEHRTNSGRRGGRMLNGSSASNSPRPASGDPGLKQRPQVNGVGRGSGGTPRRHSGEVPVGGPIRITAHRSGPFALPRR